VSAEPEFDIGRAVDFHTARDGVSLPVIRAWCDAMGCENPAHFDPDVAARARFGRIIAPMAMLDTWTLPGLAYQRDVADPRGATYEILDRSGYTSAVAVGTELTQHRPLVIDDHVRSTVMVEGVSDEKHTALGAGRFVTTQLDFLVDAEPVGHTRFTVFKFRPSGDDRSAAAAVSPPKTDLPFEPAAVERDDIGTVLTGSLDPGSAIPAVTIPITTTLIAAGAIATSDFFAPHHDRDAAVTGGSKDIFMNIHTTLGLIERCVGGWLGPNARWRSASLRLGVPNHPGDAMTVHAKITGIDRGLNVVTIGVEALNSLGSHAAGSVEVELPG
jgi:3-oxo-4,17-pregnadiene-20-carboxyl-CoA hydratase beta subunit